MGEISEMILEGILCEECGGLVGDKPEPAGHPRKCEFCQGGNETKKKSKKKNH